MAENERLKVKGSHFDCGFQIGKWGSDQICRLITISKNAPPRDLTWQDCIEKSKLYVNQTNQEYPYIIEEILGVAAGSGVDFDDVFATFVEELWSDTDSGPRQCTDAVVCPPATDGHVIVGHNNDLPADYLETVFSVEWDFDDGRKMFTVGPAGIFVSVGVNNRGICLTGNELSPNDDKVGIPRSIIAWAILNADTFDQAVKIATNPNRASSYNNVIVTQNPNKIVSVEGSATDYALIYPTAGGLVHANHYISDRMKKYETVDDLTSSHSRQQRGEEILRENLRLFTKEDIRAVLKDHGKANQPDNNTFCRHGDKLITVFSFLADMTDGVVELALGQPCETEFKEVWRF